VPSDLRLDRSNVGDILLLLELLDNGPFESIDLFSSWSSSIGCRSEDRTLLFDIFKVGGDKPIVVLMFVSRCN
jgi:hypothetical protein